MTTTATDVDTEVVVKRAEWLTSLHRLFEFFTENPEMIDGTTVHVARWPHDDNGGLREQVIRFSELTGPNRVLPMSPGSAYVQVVSDSFAPHHFYLSAQKVAVGHKVRDAVPEEWEWDALGGGS